VIQFNTVSRKGGWGWLFEKQR